MGSAPASPDRATVSVTGPATSSATGTAHGVSYLPSTIQRATKILVVGQFAVGKTTLVGAVSEIEPLGTEESMTAASVGVDDLGGVPDKSRTTVAMDFGRITLNPSLALYLFGTPGQDRLLLPVWEDIARGALGALVLVDTRRLEQADGVLSRLEEYGLPYAVAVNHFDGSAHHPLDEVRDALDLLPDTPLVDCDARDERSALNALIVLVEYLFARQEATV